MNFEKTVGVVTDASLPAREKDYIFYWQLWHHNWDDTDIAAIRESVSLTGKNVLEVGSGDGRVAFALAPLCDKFTAIDLDARFIELAEKRLAEQHATDGADSARLSFKHMDAQSLSFESGSFDTVICPWVLQMVADPDRAVDESFRVLRSGGELFVIGLRTDADYDKIIGEFVPGLPRINPLEIYEKPILSRFGAFVENCTKVFYYYFETPEIALDAFIFAIEYWYGIDLGEEERVRLSEMLTRYQDAGKVRIAFPANVYKAIKP